MVVLRHGVKLYSGRVDEMISSHGFFELKCKDQDKLINYLNNNNLFGKVTVEGDLITAFLNEPIDATTFNEMLFKEQIVLSHLVKRKESLEEQFLQLTDQTSN